MRQDRHIDKAIAGHFDQNKEILILLGARQVGKTTLLKRLFPNAHYLLVDNETVKNNLERYDVSMYKQILPTQTTKLIIDEIHLLSDPGRAAKIIYDQIPDINLIVTGSSSLQIKNRATESLAGRKFDYHLYPLTFSEYLYQKGIEENLNYRLMENVLGSKLLEKVHTFDLWGVLEKILIYGLYPHLVDQPNNQEYLKNLVDSVIFKDLVELQAIENRSGALNLLRLLAYQVGSLVNISELSNRLNMNIATVRRYLDIFEQSFIIFPLKPYSKIGRDEIGKMNKYYFYDLGLRNALIENFNPSQLRQDFGAIFENFIISELFKINVYGKFDFKMNFWRTKQGSEIDLVLTKNEEVIGVEIKTGSERANQAFLNRYPKAKMQTLTPSNFYNSIQENSRL